MVSNTLDDFFKTADYSKISKSKVEAHLCRPLHGFQTLHFIMTKTIVYPKSVWGVRIEKPSLWALVFKDFRQLKENQWPSLFVTFASRLYNCYNHAHVPGQHMWADSWPLAKLQVLQNLWKPDVHVKVKTPSARHSH